MLVKIGLSFSCFPEGTGEGKYLQKLGTKKKCVFSMDCSEYSSWLYKTTKVKRREPEKTTPVLVGSLYQLPAEPNSRAK